MDTYYNPQPMTMAGDIVHKNPQGNPQGGVAPILGRTIATVFWSIRGLWPEELWNPQAEKAGASIMAAIQAPLFVSNSTTAGNAAVMMSW